MKDETNLDRILEAEFAEDTMDLKAKLQKIAGTQKTGLTETRKKSPLRLILPALAVAAGLALAIVFLPQLLQDQTSDAVYASNYEPYPMVLNQRGGENIDLNEAIAHYSEENYMEAAKEFKTLFSNSGDYIQLLYAASAEQAGGNYQVAIDLYNQVLGSNEAKVIEQAGWYKALALIKMGKEEEGKELLRSFSQQHYKYSDAQKIAK